MVRGTGREACPLAERTVGGQLDVSVLASGELKPVGDGPAVQRVKCGGRSWGSKGLSSQPCA